MGMFLYFLDDYVDGKEQPLQDVGKDDNMRERQESVFIPVLPFLAVFSTFPTTESPVTRGFIPPLPVTKSPIITDFQKSKNCHHPEPDPLKLKSKLAQMARKEFVTEWSEELKKREKRLFEQIEEIDKSLANAVKQQGLN